MAAAASTVTTDRSIFTSLASCIYRKTTKESDVKAKLDSLSEPMKNQVYEQMNILGRHLSMRGSESADFGQRHVTENPIDPLTIKAWNVASVVGGASHRYREEIQEYFTASFYSSGQYALHKLYVRSLHDVSSESLYENFLALSEEKQNVIRKKVYDLAKAAGIYETDKPYFDFGRDFVNRDNMNHPLVKKAIREMFPGRRASV